MTPREQLAAYYEQLAAFERSVELRWEIIRAMDDDPAAGQQRAIARIEDALANLRPGRDRDPVIDAQPQPFEFELTAEDFAVAERIERTLRKDGQPRKQRSDRGGQHARPLPRVNPNQQELFA